MIHEVNSYSKIHIELDTVQSVIKLYRNSVIPMNIKQKYIRLQLEHTYLQSISLKCISIICPISNACTCKLLKN